jgi:hypothetical protein
MPLKCLAPTGAVYAFKHSAETWTGLRHENAKLKHLKMPCCDSGVVLKTSKLGTRFFAHARSGACTTAPESAEHLLAKDTIARAAELAGWQAQTEVRGTSSGSETWTADVMCQKEGVSQRIAFEVQLSPQTLEETEIRQSRYKRSGVRALWLLKSPILPVSRETPAFLLRVGAAGEDPVVCVPSLAYNSMFVSRKSASEPLYWSQVVALDEFVIGALSGKLKFGPSIGAMVPLHLYAAASRCWSCNKETSALIDLEIILDSMFPEHGNIRFQLRTIDEAGDQGLRWLEQYVGKDKLASAGIGPVKRRWSHTQQRRYLSNGCRHCDSLQGQFFEHQIAFGAEKVLTLDARVEEWMGDASDSPLAVRRWWFDRNKESI